MNYGVPINRGGFVADYPADVRADFIRKVYSLFFLSMLVTVGVGTFAAPFTPVIAGYMLPLLIAGVVCIIALSFAARVPGVNLALLMLYSVIQGAIFGPMLTIFEARFPGIAAEAGWTTIAVFGGLTAYVFASRKDFSFLGGMLFMSLIALLVAGIVMMFVHAAWASMLYSVAGVVIFSGFVLYDTSQIIHRLSPEDAVMGAVTLYLDFVNLFMFILRLFSSRRD